MGQVFYDEVLANWCDPESTLTCLPPETGGNTASCAVESETTTLHDKSADCVGKEAGTGPYSVYNYKDTAYYAVSGRVGETLRRQADGSFTVERLDELMLVGDLNNPWASARRLITSGDFNGDGLTDLLFGWEDTGFLQIAYHRGTNGHFSWRSVVLPGAPPKDLLTRSFELLVPVDYDMNGTTDLLFQTVESNVWQVALFSSSTELDYAPDGGTFVTVEATPFQANGPLLAVDANGDGFTDFIDPHLEEGQGQSPWTLYLRSGVDVPSGGGGGGGGTHEEEEPDPDKPRCEVSSGGPDLLGVIHTPTGAQLSVCYDDLQRTTNTATCTMVHSQLETPCQVRRRAVVASTRLNELPPVERTYRQPYYDPIMGLLGYERIEVTTQRDEHAPIVDIYRYEPSEYTWNYNTFSKAGRPVEWLRWIPADTFTPRHTVMRRITHHEDKEGVSLASRYLPLENYFTYSQVVTSQLFETDVVPDLDALNLLTPVHQSVSAVLDIDGFGNVLESETVVIGGATTHTENAYSVVLPAWMTKRIKETQVTRSALVEGVPTETTRHIRYGYDPSNGALESVTREPDNPIYRQTTWILERDDYGNPTHLAIESGHDGSVVSTEISYVGDEGLYPSEIDYGLGYVESFVYNQWGLLTELYGSDGVGVQLDHDLFTRPVRSRPTFRDEMGVKQEFGTVTTTTYERLLPGTGPTPLQIRTLDDTGAESLTLYNSLGQPQLEGWRLSDGWAYVEHTYDGNGRPSGRSNPQWEIEASNSGGAPTLAYTQVVYDNLDRVRGTVGLDGGLTQTSYEGHQVTVTQTALNPIITTTTEHDVHGRPIRITQGPGTTDEMTTCFVYNPNGQLLRTTKQCAPGDTPQWVHERTYDGIGRLETIDEPQGSGSRTYDYEARDRLHQITDGNGDTTVFTYDVLDRLLTTTFSKNGLSWENHYDDLFPGSLDWRKVHSSGGVQTDVQYTYDSLRRPQSMSMLPTAGAASPMEVAFTRDMLGRLETMTYPTGPGDSFTVRHHYDPTGRIQMVTRDETLQALWTEVWVRPEGMASRTTTGNNIVTDTTYDVAGRLMEILAGPVPAPEGDGGGGIDQLTQTPTVDTVLWQAYSRPMGGRIDSRMDLLHDVSENYMFDHVGRLTDVAALDTGTGAIQNQTVSYDGFNTMGSMTGVGTFDMTPAGRVERAGARVYTHDANGHVTHIGVDNAFGNEPAPYLPMNIHWTGHGKALLLDSAAGSISYSYGPDGNWVQRVLGGPGIPTETTTRMGRVYERHVVSGGSTEHRYTVGLPDGTAMVTTQTLDGDGILDVQTRYTHRDVHASAAAITDEFGELVTEPRYS
ncbi:MAG: hypothetical protein AAFS10_05730, partial [Myxococcota bacterium]